MSPPTVIYKVSSSSVSLNLSPEVRQTSPTSGSLGPIGQIAAARSPGHSPITNEGGKGRKGENIVSESSIPTEEDTTYRRPTGECLTFST